MLLLRYLNNSVVGVAADSVYTPFFHHPSHFASKIFLYSPTEMKDMATYLMLVLGGNENPTADDVSKALASVGVESDSEQLNKMISELEGKDLSEVLASGEELLAKFGSGGGGGGGGGTFYTIGLL